VRNEIDGEATVRELDVRDQRVDCPRQVVSAAVWTAGEEFLRMSYQKVVASTASPALYLGKAQMRESTQIACSSRMPKLRQQIFERGLQVGIRGHAALQHSDLPEIRNKVSAPLRSSRWRLARRRQARTTKRPSSRPLGNSADIFEIASHLGRRAGCDAVDRMAATHLR